MSTKCEHALAIIPIALCLQSGLIFIGAFDTIPNSCIFYAYAKTISGTSGKNHFYKMNGDVGTAGW